MFWFGRNKKNKKKDRFSKRLSGTPELTPLFLFTLISSNPKSALAHRIYKHGIGNYPYPRPFRQLCLAGA